MATQGQPAWSRCRLAEAPLRDVLTLLGHELGDWRRRLSWDPAEMGQALEAAATARLLPGTAVLEGRRAVAYLSCQPAAGLLRLCSVRLPASQPAHVAALLVEGLLAEPAARRLRLEGQLVAFEAQDALDAAFAGRGVGVVPRRWLGVRLAAGAPGGWGDLALRPFRASDLDGCAAVLVAAHAGSVEAEINQAFRTLPEARAYLQDVVRGPGCGRFSPWASSIALVDGEVAGFCLASTVATGIAHVPQVAVSPEHQAHGLGTALLTRTRALSRRDGCRHLTLSVSEPNEAACRWYEHLGFTVMTRFSAYHRPAPGGRATA